MGATYTRQSSYSDGDTITAAHTNDEFNQLLAAFASSSGHTHDGTAAEGGPITKLLGTSITIGDGTSGTDITVTYDGESNDGVMKWMEDEDYFEFSDDILVASTEKLQFRDTALYINSSTDGQLDIVADTEVQIAATTIDINGNVDISGTLTIGSAGISEAELEVLDGLTVSTTEVNILDGDTSATSTTVADADRVVMNDNGTMVQVAVTDLAAYFDDEITAMPNLTSVGTLTTLTVDNVIVNGTTIGHTSDTDLMTLTSGVLTVAGEVDATTLDISGNADIDGTTNLDEVDIDGAVQIDGATTFGVDDTGVDVKFFGATSGAYLLWDESADKLLTAGGAVVDIVKDKLLIGGTAVTTTAAELNVLDGVTAGTVTASKGVVVDSNKDLGTLRNLTIDGTFSDGNYTFDTSGNVTGLGTVSSGNITSSGTVQGTVITATTGFAPDASDGAYLGTSSLQFSDLYLADGAVVNLGDDQDVTLTHVADTGILLNSTNQLQFGDSGTYIHQSADGVLDLVSDTEIEINATTIDVNGAVDISGNTTIGGNLTVNGTTTTIDTTNTTVKDSLLELNSGASSNSNDVGIIIQRGSTGNDALFMWDESEDKFALGTTTDNASSTGNLNMTTGTLVANIEGNLTGTASTATVATTVTITDNESTDEDNAIIFTAGGDVDGGNIGLESDGDLTYNPSTGRLTATQLSGTIQTAAQTNITSLGTLSALTVDNVAIDSNTIGHTSDTDLMTLTSGVVTVAGEVSMTTLDIGGTNVSSTATELNVMDGDTTATSTTLANADRIVVNDDGTMKQVALTDVKTYLTSAGYVTDDPTALAIALG